MRVVARNKLWSAARIFRSKDFRGTINRTPLTNLWTLTVIASAVSSAWVVADGRHVLILMRWIIVRKLTNFSSLRWHCIKIEVSLLQWTAKFIDIRFWLFYLRPLGHARIFYLKAHHHCLHVILVSRSRHNFNTIHTSSLDYFLAVHAPFFWHGWLLWN
jgi:hypothetical protein